MFLLHKDLAPERSTHATPVAAGTAVCVPQQLRLVRSNRGRPCPVCIDQEGDLRNDAPEYVAEKHRHLMILRSASPRHTNQERPLKQPNGQASQKRRNSGHPNPRNPIISE